MKRYILAFIFTFSLIFIQVKAENVTTARAYITSGCNIRTSPQVPKNNSNKLGGAYKGTYYLLVEDTTFPDQNNHYDCTTDWYKVYYNGTPAYICGEHVEVVRSYSQDNIQPQNACEVEMNSLGFPSSYWSGLCKLRTMHPNWQFVALKTGDEWANAVREESPCGKNLIYESSKNSAYIDTTCTIRDKTYVGMTTSGVAYYMDPRNFLGESSIFQFLHLGYNSNFTTTYLNGVQSILQNAKLYEFHKSKGTDLVSTMNEIGASVGISPIFSASRMIQELGSGDGTKDLYSGEFVADPNTASGQAFIELTGSADIYKGFYNFFNYGVSTTCNTNYGRTYCGLSYAYKQNPQWNSPYNALYGGMKQLVGSYINKNQYTGYLQKFNAIGSDSYGKYTHQYMTNIEAPSSEANTTYSTYSKLNILETPFIFYIPVYNNMSQTILNSPNGAVDDGNNVAVPSSIPVYTIVTSSGFRYSNGYISNIGPGTDANSIKSAIESVGGNATVSITDANGNAITSGIIGTGCKVLVNNQSTTEVLTVIVRGDTSGDGIINALDLLQVQKNILGTYALEGAYLLAADPSNDGKVNALDLLQVQKQILGTYTIEQ